MAILIGAVLAVAVGVFASFTCLDRDRAFYPTVTIVVASYYALFAVMGGSVPVLVLECVVIVGFVVAAVVGFRVSLWIVAAALAAHGLFDLVHGELIANTGVPGWWPGFCGAYDLMAAAYLGWMLRNYKRIEA